jgi:hypothetical protein
MNAQSNNLYKKWFVYSTCDSSSTGWSTVIDSYILDFSNMDTLFIKAIGENDVQTFLYSFNAVSGVINGENGEVLYTIKSLASDRLILSFGAKSTVQLNLVPLDDYVVEVDILDKLRKCTWHKDSTSIKFTNEQFKIVNEINTNYKVYIEKNAQLKSVSEGAWQIDFYKGLCFIEFYSERWNYRRVYQIKSISHNKFIAVSTDKNGQPLVLELVAF